MGSIIPAYDDSFGLLGNVFTNSATTMFVGTPAELVSAAIP